MTTKVSKQPYQLWVRMAAWLRRPEVWLVLAIAGLLSLVLWWLNEPLEGMLIRAGQLRGWILQFGPLAPLVYIGIFSLQILFAPIPGHFLGVMGGYLFGVMLGSLYSIAGLSLGAGLAIFIARQFGRPLLERFFEPAQITYWEKRLRMRSPLTWWLLFIFPVPDLIFYVAGLSSVPVRVLLLTLLAGRGLGLLIANTMGHWTAHLAPEWVLVKWGIIGALGILAYLYQRRLRLVVLLTARRLRRWGRRWMSAA